MKFDEEDKKELRDIGVTSLLDLALLLPKNYDDLTIKNRPNEGENTVEIECNFQRRKGSILTVSAFCITWQCEVKIVIFNAKGWHFGMFKNGKKMFIHAKSNFAYGSWQFINPAVVTKIGQIIPKYKTSVKDGIVERYIKKYINFDSLLDSGLNAIEAKVLTDIHKNDRKSLDIIKNLNSNKEIINTLKFIEIFNYMQKLSYKKTDFPARKIEIYNILPWLKKLPFIPTKDQLNALDDIKRDFLSQRASRRVVMGDVGSGKTLIILGAALMNYPGICYLMVPTSILAEQIYNEALRLLPEFMKILHLKSGDKNVNFKGVNFVIGTHVLLYQDLDKANLIMVDEQHRFGSIQRNRIEHLTKDGEFRAHYIQFSATPIPRTMSLIQSELVNFSFLKQIPYEKKIKTIILQNNGFSELIKHIKDQISKNKQIIVVYPLVEESDVSNYQSLEEATPFWMQHFKNVYVTHGKDKDKERILQEFREKGDLLLTTTVVEVGISLPKLSTIVIVAAERLGLATLHQLRGRVGRKGGDGWCYLYTKLKNPPKRLYDFSCTLDGFKVAAMDLKNRQAGDLLDGTIQHGQTFTWYEMEEELAKTAKNRLHAKK